jgi:hypothetical protein
MSIAVIKSGTTGAKISDGYITIYRTEVAAVRRAQRARQVRRALRVRGAAGAGATHGTRGR